MRKPAYYVAAFVVVAVTLFVGFGLTSDGGFGVHNAGWALAIAIGVSVGSHYGERLHAQRQGRRTRSAR